MNSLNEYQLARLEQAATCIDPNSVQTVLRLRVLVQSTKAADHAEFRNLFMSFYRLNTGGLTEAFKKRYFELLFACDPLQVDPYTSLLRELYLYPRRRGDYALHGSFVSKLVATRDESRPLYDRYVSEFFGLSAPGTGSIEFRIAGFVANLNRLRATYLAWIDDPRLKAVLNLAAEKTPRVRDLHPVRVCDFLVWTIGVHGIG